MRALFLTTEGTERKLAQSLGQSFLSFIFRSAKKGELEQALEWWGTGIFLNCQNSVVKKRALAWWTSLQYNKWPAKGHRALAGRF
ncbi:MAG: hypothetical protein WD578_13495, partial [Bacteroidales bacterium]